MGAFVQAVWWLGLVAGCFCHCVKVSGYKSLGMPAAFASGNIERSTRVAMRTKAYESTRTRRYTEFYSLKMK